MLKITRFLMSGFSHRPLVSEQDASSDDKSQGQPANLNSGIHADILLLTDTTSIASTLFWRLRGISGEAAITQAMGRYRMRHRKDLM